MPVITGQCAAAGCQKPTFRNYRFCGQHHNNEWRHGHPLQTAVTFKQVSPFVCRVAEAISAREDAGNIWRVLEVRWSAYLTGAVTVTTQGIFSDPESASTVTARKALRHEIEAAHAIKKTAEAGIPPKPREIVANVVALILMREMEPERFQDDRAFLFQVARRFICLNPANATKTAPSRSSTNYRPLKAKAMEHLGEYLLKALGAFGLALVASIREGMAERAAELKDYEAAVVALGPRMIPIDSWRASDDLFPSRKHGPRFDPETGIRSSILRWYEKNGGKTMTTSNNDGKDQNV